MPLRPYHLPANADATAITWPRSIPRSSLTPSHLANTCSTHSRTFSSTAFDVLLLLSFALGLLIAAASVPEARYSRAYLLLGMACVLLVWLSMVAGKPSRAGARR